MTRKQCMACDDLVLAFLLRLEWLKDNPPPSCSKCGEPKQFQLIDWLYSDSAKWKCRTCKYKFNYEPKLK